MALQRVSGIWMEVLDEGDPEDDGAAFNEDEDGFIKAV